MANKMGFVLDKPVETPAEQGKDERKVMRMPGVACPKCGMEFAVASKAHLADVIAGHTASGCPTQVYSTLDDRTENAMVNSMLATLQPGEHAN